MTLSGPRFSIFFAVAESKMCFLARLSLTGFVFVSLSAAVFAKSDRLAACRSADLDARIAGCTDVIARGGQETKRNQITAYINRGGAYRAKGDFARALADLDKAVQLDPRAALALMERASIYFAKGDLDRAIADYNEAIAARPKSAAAFYGRGEAYRAKNDLDHAIADYDRALQIEKNSAAAYAGRAKAHRGKGDFDEALADFEEAVKLDPKSASLHVDRGAVYQTKGDLDQAITDYDEAIEIDPKYATAFLDRAKIYSDKHDLGRARQDIETALTLDPQLASAKEALDELNRLIAKNATPPAVATPAPPPAAPAAAAPMLPPAPATPTPPPAPAAAAPIHFDSWTLALQTVNFAVLVWLLHRFLYKPVLRMIDARKAEVQKQYDEAKAAEEAAQAHLAAIKSERAGLVSEREAALKAAAAQAEEAAKARRAQAEAEAAALLDGTRKTLATERDKVLAEARKSALDLGIGFSRRLLAEVPVKLRTEAWLERIERYLVALPKAEMEALVHQFDNGGALTVVTASPLASETAETWRDHLRRSVGDGTAIAFDANSDLVAGAELHFPSAVLRFSWQSTLAAARSEIEA
jgi:F-type H+-transporting ATPase subunit b